MTSQLKSRILLFSDPFGAPPILKQLTARLISGLVAAEARPEQHADMQELAREHHIPLLVQPRKQSSQYDAFVKSVRELDPDLILVNSYSMLLQGELLDIPVRGAVNIHGALLPRYRGANPIQWALLNNEHETGVTIHFMTPVIDAGDIIAQASTPIFISDTWRNIHLRCGKLGVDLLEHHLPGILNGTCRRMSQDESRARRYPRRKPDDGLIDWDKSVLQIHNLVRALVKPHPGAFYINNAQRVILDEPMSLPKILSMKFGPEGNKSLVCDTCTVEPLSSRNGSSIFRLLLAETTGYSSLPPALVSLLNTRNRIKSALSRNDTAVFRATVQRRIAGLFFLSEIDFMSRATILQFPFAGHLPVEEDLFKTLIQLLLQVVFRELELHRVAVQVPVHDHVTQRLFAALGFSNEGIARETARISLGFSDMLVMSLLENEFGS